MHIKHTAAALAVVAGVSGVALFGANAVSAQGSDQTSLAKRIATRFNLNQDEVQAVFDEVQLERKTEHEQHMDENLQALVDDGTITAEQKTLIEEARADMKAKADEIKPDDFRNLTSDQREAVHQQMKELRDAFEQKLTDAGINLDDIKPDHDHMGGPGHHKGGHDF